MSILDRPAKPAVEREHAFRDPRPRLLLPWGFLLASAWLLGGIYLDGWAHNHGKVDESFFTPWHAVLYSGYLAAAAVLLLRGRGVLPPGYWISLIGVVVFALGGLGDMMWHIVFGIEVDIAALLSPTHLILAVGAGLIVAGPLRAAWLEAEAQPRGALRWVPTIASLTMLYAVIAFMGQFANPQVWPQADSDQAHVSVGSDDYVMSADGTAQTRLIRASGLDAAQAAWSPDGQYLAFTTWS